MIKKCPRCNQRYSVNFYDVDFVHDCNSDSATINNEDVVVVGDYIDESTDTSVTIPKLEANLQGIANKRQGMSAGIDGANVDSVTSRGNREATHRTRKHKEYIKLK